MSSRKDIAQKVLDLYKEELEMLPPELGGVPVFDKPDVRIAAASDPQGNCPPPWKRGNKPAA